MQWSVPVKESRTLLVSWALPSLRNAYATKPDSYLSHLIGHEGPGSILSHLKAKGWASGLSAGTFDNEREYATVRMRRRKRAARVVCLVLCPVTCLVCVVG